MTSIQLSMGFAIVLIGWLFVRGNITNNKIEAIRIEMAGKVGDLYQENKEDRKQHDCDMREIQKSIHAMTDTLSDEIRRLDIMGVDGVKEYVGFMVEPLKEDFAGVKKVMGDVVKQVDLLIERSK